MGEMTASCGVLEWPWTICQVVLWDKRFSVYGVELPVWILAAGGATTGVNRSERAASSSIHLRFHRETEKTNARAAFAHVSAPTPNLGTNSLGWSRSPPGASR